MEPHEVKVVDSEDCITSVIFPNGVAEFAKELGVDLVMVDSNGDVFTWKKGDKEWVGLGIAPQHEVLTIVKKN
jgi:hypothetical protein